MLILALFICSLLAMPELYINEKSNSFGDFSLGAGFDINRFEPLTQHVFKEFVADGVTKGVTYDFLPVKKSTTRCGIVRTDRDLTEKLMLSGEASIERPTMSGSGFLKYDSSTEKMEKVVYYTCVVDRGLFTVSVNPPQVDIDDSYETLAEVLPKHLINLSDQDQFIQTAGDYHVRSITYGRRYKAEVMMTYQHDETYESLVGELEVEAGLGGMSIAAKVNWDWSEEESNTDMRMSVSSESFGFIPPETLQLPTGITTVTQDDGTTVDLTPFQFVERQLKINLEKMDEMDAESSTYQADTGLTRKELFQKLGDAYPLSYKIAKNEPFYSILTPLTAMQERDMVKNIDEAYDILRELNSLHEDISDRAEKLFESFHLLSDESDLSIPFLHVRQSLMDEIASFQKQVKVYLTRMPIYLAHNNIYEWVQATDFDVLNSQGEPTYPWAQDEAFLPLEYISLDVLRSKIWRLMGMEDGQMDINEDAIGATCIFSGIEGDYSFDGVTTQRLHFAGRVVFADKVIRHVVFNKEQNVISLGFIDHDNDEESWPELDNPLCNGHTMQQLHHELVFVKNDCTLLRFGTPVWYEDARYVVCGVGSAEHLTKNGYVNKDMLSSIRVNLVPVDSAQDITIVLTENEIQHVSLRGAESSLGFSMDDNHRLMWSNGYVCDWSFGVKEAKMVCSELGYSRIEKFETNVELPTSNAWERPLIKMYDIDCQEYAMTLDGGHCTYSTHPAGINWDQCSKNNGIMLECSDLVLEHNEIEAEISSSNSEGCHFNEDMLNAGLVNTDEHCIGGEDQQDGFGLVTEVDVHGEVCLSFIVNDEVQCVFSEGSHALEGCGSSVMTTDKDTMLADGWEIADGFTAISNDQCSSSTFNGQPSSLTDIISKTFSGAGHATITFGNCGNSGEVILSFNGHQIASAHAGSYAEVVTFDYSDAQELKLEVAPDSEGNAEAVIRVQQLELSYPCASVEASTVEYSQCYTDYDGSFPESVEIINDANFQEIGGTAQVESEDPFETYSISATLVEYINLDGTSGNVPDDFSLELKVTIDGSVNTINFDFDLLPWDSTEISGLRCGTSFNVEVISDQSQHVNVCEPIGTRPIDAAGKGVISGTDVNIKVRCQQINAGVVAAYWKPPQDCECVAATRTDGLIWLPSCSRVPESNETPYCYVDPNSCPSAVSNEFSDEFETVECKQFTWWKVASSSYSNGVPVTEFIESEFPEWKYVPTYQVDLETIDLIVFPKQGNSLTSLLNYYPEMNLQQLLNEIEARNIAIAMVGHNDFDLDFGLRQTLSTSHGVISTMHFPESGGLSEPIVFQASDEIITSGFENGQSVSVAKKLSSYTYTSDSDSYYTPLYNPSGDYETIAYTKRATNPNFSGAYYQPALVRHKNRPLITVPWGIWLQGVEMTDDGRQVVRNCFEWLAHERTQSSGRRMLAEVGWNLESTERNVPTIAIFMLVLLVSVSLCVCVSCRRKKSAKESSDYKTEIICV